MSCDITMAVPVGFEPSHQRPDPIARKSSCRRPESKTSGGFQPPILEMGVPQVNVNHLSEVVPEQASGLSINLAPGCVGIRQF